jgi:Domain of unknown function (DUF5666)
VAERATSLRAPYRMLSSLLGDGCNLREMSKRSIGAALPVLAALCVFTGVAAAASPVSGSISGPVTSVKGSTFTVTTKLSPTGKATVTVGKSATITTEETVAVGSLKTGDCVMATGAKNSKGVVAAQRISLTTAVKGQCTAGFGRRGTGGGRPPGAPTGGTKPPTTGGGNGGGFGNFANFGVAFGKITADKGGTLTVSGTINKKATTTTVTVSSKTQVSKTVQIGTSGIAVKDCAFVRGTSADKGVTVTAQNVSITKPRNGSCTFGFGGR